MAFVIEENYLTKFVTLLSPMIHSWFIEDIYFKYLTTQNCV